jgi:hypothetical protein
VSSRPPVNLRLGAWLETVRVSIKESQSSKRWAGSPNGPLITPRPTTSDMVSQRSCSSARTTARHGHRQGVQLGRRPHRCAQKSVGPCPLELSEERQLRHSLPQIQAEPTP